MTLIHFIRIAIEKCLSDGIFQLQGAAVTYSGWNARFARSESLVQILEKSMMGTYSMIRQLLL